MDERNKEGAQFHISSSTKDKIESCKQYIESKFAINREVCKADHGRQVKKTKLAKFAQQNEQFKLFGN